MNKSKGQKHSRLKNGEYLLTGRMQPDGHNKGIQCGVLLFNLQTINTIMFAFKRNRRHVILNLINKIICNDAMTPVEKYYGFRYRLFYRIGRIEWGAGSVC